MSPAEASAISTRVDPLEHVDLAGPALLDDRAVGPDGGELDRLRHGAREDAADGQPAEVVRIVDVGDDHLVRARRRRPGPGCARGSRRGAGRRSPDFAVGIPRDVAQPAGAVEDLELEVVLFGREREEEIVDFLLDLLRPRVGAVDLVDEHDRPLAALEGLLQDEARLRQRALRRRRRGGARLRPSSGCARPRNRSPGGPACPRC